MAHHQHHGADYEAQLSRSIQSRPTSASATSMPMISEDEMLAEADEPPDPQPKSTFTKHALPLIVRRESLLTQALHSESESHDEGPHRADYFKLPSVSSTASSHSVRSVGDFTSDEGHMSPNTRPSTPGSPRTAMGLPKIRFPSRQNSNLSSTDSHHESDRPQSAEASVEAKLGRKRCIMFACGKKDNTTAPKPESILATETKTKTSEPPKRACTIKFACPFKASNSKAEEPLRTTSRHLSPAPPQKHTNASGTAFSRRHRDSDATIRDESPTTPRGTLTPLSPVRVKPRRMNSNSELSRAEACRFHEFASEVEEQEDWTQESTCHRSRLTVDDTLKKEHEIRRLAEEVDEEEAIEREIKENLSDDEDDDDIFSDDSDEGFQSDDEEGFADSDDEEDSDGDYEWWVPRRSATASPFVGNGVFRPVSGRTYSDSSIESSDGQLSPKARGRKSGNRALPLNIRARTPDLPDSTDFVCGTLDEDRPQEEAYLRGLAARKASRHKPRPQDIDPTFPISDPETDSDDDKKDPAKPSKLHEESDHFMHGRPSEDDNEEHRGRRLNDTPPKRLHFESPKRLRSPPPPKKSCATHRSPAPRMLFGGNRSPRKHLSPAPANRVTSPPPSRRGSTTASPSQAARYGVPFLSNHMNHLTHTASLPRSPHPFFRKRNSSPPPPARTTNDDDDEDQDKDADEDEDDGSATDRPNDTHRYTRGAIDIAQGLERKRLKRREKFHKQYQRKEEKKERKGVKKRPTPGQGAERMRQVGLDCAVYKGTRMLSI